MSVLSSISCICILFPGASFQLFFGGPKFFLFFNATGLLKNWKKQHFICSNLTLFIVPFFLSFLFFLLFSLFSFFSFFFLFFLFSFSLGGATAPQPPSNNAPASSWILYTYRLYYYIIYRKQH